MTGFGSGKEGSHEKKQKEEADVYYAHGEGSEVAAQFAGWCERFQAPGDDGAGCSWIYLAFDIGCKSIGRWMMWITALLIAFLGGCGLVVEFIDPALRTSAEHLNNILISVGWLVFWSVVAVATLPKGVQPSARISEQTEQAYLIQRKCDGYPMVVGSDAYDQAYWTGDYDILGRINGSVPVGQQYVDERLN